MDPCAAAQVAGAPGSGAPDLCFDIEWHPSGEPFLTWPGNLTDPVSQAILETAGRRPEFSTGGGTSDGRFIVPAGADVVELGSVNASIHKIDQHVWVADVADLCRMYERTLELLLLRPPEA